MTKIVQFKVRLPSDLHQKLVRAAASRKPKRSLNSEIVTLLYESMMEKEEFAETIRDMKGRLDGLHEWIANVEKAISKK